MPVPSLSTPERSESTAGDQGSRVLVVAPQPFYEDRGTPIAIRHLVEALSELGYQTDLLTYAIGHDIAAPGLRILRSPNPLGIERVPVGFSINKLLLDATLVPALLARLRRERYRCIHAVEEAAFPAVLLGRRFKVPVIYDMQSSMPEQMTSFPLLGSGSVQYLMHRCERWLLRRADLVVASSGLADHVRKTAPGARVREWRYPTLAPTVTPKEVAELRRKLDIPAGARVVVYTGTFEPYQGLPELVAAIPAVRAAHPDTIFVLVGAAGNGRHAIQQQVESLGVGSAVRIVARQPREAIPGFLAMADVLVSTRAYGGNQPLKVGDYLAAGRPIVATDSPSHWAVLDADRALLVRHSAHEFAGAISMLLADHARAAGLAERARHYAETNLSWAGFVRSVEEIQLDVEQRRQAG